MAGDGDDTTRGVGRRSTGVDVDRRSTANKGTPGTSKKAPAAEPPKRPPELHIVLELYPLRPIDAAESVLRDLAIKRAKAARNRRAVAIDEIGDIFTLLELMAENISKQTGQKKVAPFISELHILGHGNPGKFGIGFYMYDSTAFKAMTKGKAQQYLEDNAAIYLDGCYAASGPQGKELLYQIGRVFLGDKHGSITGNTGLVQVIGEMGTFKPVTLRYPENVVTPAK